MENLVQESMAHNFSDQLCILVFRDGLTFIVGINSIHPYILKETDDLFIVSESSFKLKLSELKVRIFGLGEQYFELSILFQKRVSKVVF